MHELMSFSIALELVNSILLIGLLWVYYQNYQALKLPEAMGMMVFAFVLLLQNLAGLYFHFSMGEFYIAELASQILILELIETIALAVLSYTAWKE